MENKNKSVNVLKNLLGSKIYQCNLKFDFLNNTFLKWFVKIKEMHLFAKQREINAVVYFDVTQLS